MPKKLKHKLAGWFLRCYTRRRDLSHTIYKFKQLPVIPVQCILPWH